MPTAEPKQKKLRWLRISLRTFFVLLTVACIWFGWKVNCAQQQREAVALIRRMGGSVIYDYWFEQEDGEPPLPTWMHSAFGIDLFADVRYAELIGSNIRELLPLEAFTELHGLSLSSTQVNDVTPLGTLRNLRYLVLRGTPISEPSYRALQQALPNCYIEWLSIQPSSGPL